MVLTPPRAALLAAILLSCRSSEATSVRASEATSVRATTIPALALRDTAGGTTIFPDAVAQAPLTVIVFFAEHCPCFQMHESRLRDLASDFGNRGVKLMIVDSEVRATSERDRNEAAVRKLPPIVLDPGARLADALGAEYATYAVVLDAQGVIRYRGGIDDDRNVAHPDARTWLRDALEDLVAGKSPRKAEGKVLGCALQKQ